MRSDLPSGTVTFLFTDVEGSTKLLHELGAEAYDEALITHRSALREAFQRHGGVEVDTQGDAFFYAFPTAPGAVDAAREGIEALSSGPIRVRVGLHTGTPHIGKEGYIGDDVHLGARIAGTAHGGQVVLSRETRVLVEGDITDLGEHRLKDIPQAIPIFQLGNGSFPPLKTISNTNLPTPASSFVGRDDELLEVLSRVEDGARLVTLTGPGGTGKTRLAIEAASTLVPEYKAGVFWVALASLRDPALVTETIAQTLGAQDGLAEHIAEREILLLLDNLEQVIECAPELSQLLSACPNLTLLVTSRELLRIQGEVEYAVPPLAEPEAVSLFCERAQLEPSETIAGALSTPGLAAACGRVGRCSYERPYTRADPGAPLAAARPAQGRPRRDPRQQTLRATIEWSYELLSPRRAAALRAPLSLRRRLHAGGRGRDLRSRPRHAAVAGREEPAALHRRSLLDAGDDPRVRGASGSVEADARRDSRAPRALVPTARRGGRAALEPERSSTVGSIGLSTEDDESSAPASRVSAMIEPRRLGIVDQRCCATGRTETILRRVGTLA